MTGALAESCWGPEELFSCLLIVSQLFIVATHPYVNDYRQLRRAASASLSERLSSSLLEETWERCSVEGSFVVRHSVRHCGLSPSGCRCQSSVHLSIDIYCEGTSHPLWQSVQLQEAGRAGNIVAELTRDQWSTLLLFDLTAAQEMIQTLLFSSFFHQATSQSKKEP